MVVFWIEPYPKPVFLARELLQLKTTMYEHYYRINLSKGFLSRHRELAECISHALKLHAIMENSIGFLFRIPHF